jgi:hypothetical protein
MFNRKTTALATTALAAALAIVLAGPGDGSSTVPITACGQTVTTNAVLTKHLTCAGSNGINVGAAGITIDLNRQYRVRDLHRRRVRVREVVDRLRTRRNGIAGASASVKSSTASGNGQTGISVSGTSVSVSSSAAPGTP